MLGGQFDLSGRLVPTGRSDAALALDYELSLAGAEMGQAVFDNRNIDLSGGRTDLTIEGAGAGSSQAAILAGMSGKGSLTIENTVLKGFDLARLNARYAAAENPGELVRLIQSSMSSGSTRIASLNGDFAINDGVIAFDDLLIRTSAGNVRALVAADLPHWRLDSTASIRLAAETRAPTLDMQVSGPLNATKRDFDSDALQAFILEESARRAAARNTPQNRPPQNTPAPQQSVPQNNPVPQVRQTPQTLPTPQTQPSRTPQVESLPSSAPPLPTQPASQAPRLSPTAPDNATGQPPAPFVPGSRTLSVSPNAAKPESPVPGARVLSVSPNAARPGASPADSAPLQNAPITSQPVPAESPLGARPSGQPLQQSQPSPQSQPQTQDPDSFARDVLRGLEP